MTATIGRRGWRGRKGGGDTHVSSTLIVGCTNAAFYAHEIGCWCWWSLRGVVRWRMKIAFANLPSPFQGCFLVLFVFVRYQMSHVFTPGVGGGLSCWMEGGVFSARNESTALTHTTAVATTPTATHIFVLIGPDGTAKRSSAHSTQTRSYFPMILLSAALHEREVGQNRDCPSSCSPCGQRSATMLRMAVETDMSPCGSSSCSS